MHAIIRTHNFDFNVWFLCISAFTLKTYNRMKFNVWYFQWYVSKTKILGGLKLPPPIPPESILKKSGNFIKVTKVPLYTETEFKNMLMEMPLRLYLVFRTPFIQNIPWYHQRVVTVTSKEALNQTNF